MRTDDFDFDLPPDLIAQVPAPRREDARLLALSRTTGAVEHLRVPDLADLLRPGDVLVVNDTQVLRARLPARRATGGRVEVFLLEPRAVRERGDDETWEALVRAGGAIQEGELLDVVADGTAVGSVRLVRRLDGGHWIVAAHGATFGALMDRAGRIPLPPYIRREPADPRDALDAERYQTVYAREPGAVAAPTAGLHLTEPMLERLAAGGVRRVHVTLHVGLGTFRPVTTETIEAHVLHEEPYVIPAATAAAIRDARAGGGRVVAVGTTSVRALETSAAASPDGLPSAGAGRTSIFIAPGHTFRAVDALLTNFHLPRSTLLCLVSAFADRERVLAAYREAVAQRYRFFSYGDAMFLA